jgi:hypothetical protein
MNLKFFENKIIILFFLILLFVHLTSEEKTIISQYSSPLSRIYREPQDCMVVYTPLGYIPQRDQFFSTQYDPAFSLGFVSELPSYQYWLKRCNERHGGRVDRICLEYEEISQYIVEYLFPKSLILHPQVQLFNSSSNRYDHDLLFIPFMYSFMNLDEDQGRARKLSADDNSYLKSLELNVFDEDVVQIDLWNNDQAHPIKMFFHGNVGSSRGIRREFHDDKSAHAIHSYHIHIPYAHRESLFNWRSKSEIEMMNPMRARPYIAFFMGSLGKATHTKTRLVVAETMSRLQKGLFVDIASNSSNTLQGYMHNVFEATFCPCPLGDSDDTKRIYTSILGGCIPIIASDWLMLPFEGFLDWSTFSIIVPESVIGETILSLLSIDQSRIIELRKGLLCVREHFMYNEDGSRPGDSTDMILAALSLRGRIMREQSRWMKGRH